MDTPGAQNHRWWLCLGVVCGGALLLRLGVIFWLDPSRHVGGDPFQYHYGANFLVEGRGFIDASSYLFKNQVRQSAQHPPLYSLVLAIPSALGLRSVLAHQLFSCLIGTGTVAVVGVVGRRIAGPTVGLIAACLAAVYPNMWLFEGLLYSETLTLLTTSLTLLAAYRFWDRRDGRTAAELGVACALAALTRGEAVLFLPLIVVPWVLLARQPRPPRRLGLALVAAVAAGLTMMPWTVFNLARFRYPVPVADDLGITLAGANCENTYGGQYIGYFGYTNKCIPDLPAVSGADETDDAHYYQSAGLRYLRAHRSRLPAVVLAREGRTWGFYQPFGQVRIDAYLESRNLTAAKWGLVMYWMMAVAAVAGAVVLRRRQVPLSPLIALFVTVAVTVAVTYGETRFRASAEPALVLLSAVAFYRASVWIWSRLLPLFVER
ncbi:MAG: glycosyltransferase family 39 protein [Acidimicrobiales bacterium]